jgi:hypothetical protein
MPVGREDITDAEGEAAVVLMYGSSSKGLSSLAYNTLNPHLLKGC